MDALKITNDFNIIIEIIKASINFTFLIFLAYLSYLAFQKRLARNLEIEKSGRYYIRELRANDAQRSRIFLASVIGDYFKQNKKSTSDYDIEEIKAWFSETIDNKILFDKFIEEIWFIKGSLEEIGRITTSPLAWEGIIRDFIFDWTVEFYQYWYIMFDLIKHQNITKGKVILFRYKIGQKGEWISKWNALLKNETIPKICSTLYLSSEDGKEFFEKHAITSNQI